MPTLQDRVAAVSGGTRGVGRAIAQAFVREGAFVVINGRNREIGEAVAAELSASGRVTFYPGDVCEQSVVEGLVDAAVAQHGRIDVLALNAGGPHQPKPITRLSDNEWRHVIDLNLSHVFWGMRRALTHMIPRNHGRIIVTAAVEAKMGRAEAAGYVAAKHGVCGLVKSAAHEVGTNGITINAIVPGYSPRGERDSDARSLATLWQRSVIKRPTLDDEVAAVAALLAANSTTSITGCMFPVDGGVTPY